MSIFTRFAGVSFVSFGLFIGLSIFFLYELFSFYTTITYIVDVDSRLLEEEKKVTERLISQLQYEKKYLVLKDEQLYAEYRKTVAETSEAIDALAALADVPSVRLFARQVRESFNEYLAIVEEEFSLVRKNRLLQAARLRDKKQVLERDIFEKLELLEEHARRDSFMRINLLRESVYEARNITSVAAAGVFLILIFLSFLVARSITVPISKLIQKSRSIALGNLDVQRSVTSPPEIAELDEACYGMAQKLKQIDAMKSDFFTTMSHELRTPLTSINEGAKLLLEESQVVSPEVQKRLTSIISEQSARLIELVNSVLDLSKMEAGMMRYHFRSGDIKKLIEQVVREYDLLAASRSIALTLTIDNKLSPVKLDEERILQVLRNLVGNAFRFTSENGTISISARIADQALQVSVADTGVGIPAEDLPSIFDKFYQSSDAKGRDKGTGLGLALVKNIVLAHGGNVWATSTLGQGSCFTFSLPCS